MSADRKRIEAVPPNPRIVVARSIRDAGGSW